MKTLAIFGDSYGRSGGYDNNEKDWVKFIEDTGEYNITNFSKGGSPLWYSYDLFVKNKDKFDKIIFLITAPHRIGLVSPISVLHPFQNNNVRIKVDLASGKEKEQYQTIIDYYDLIHDYNREETIHQLMVENISRIRNDAIIYPCFFTSYLDDIPLYEITKFEDACLGLNKEIQEKFYKEGRRDSRNCHMTESNNKIVSQLFLNRLNGINYKLDVGQLVKPTVDVNYYYQSIWTIEKMNSLKNI
jgi:hypothetical protein